MYYVAVGMIVMVLFGFFCCILGFGGSLDGWFLDLGCILYDYCMFDVAFTRLES